MNPERNFVFTDSDNSVSDEFLTPILEHPNQKRQQRKTISSDLREQMYKFFSSGRSDSYIAAEMHLPRSTVYSILSKFRKTGTLDPKPRGGNRRPLLSLEQKEKIINWVDENSLITLKELKQNVHDEFGIVVSLSTVDRVIGQFHYTLKSLVRVPERQNCQTTIQKRLEYSEMFRELETMVMHESIIFLDEVGFAVVTRPKRGRSLKGKSAYCFVSAARSRNISVVAAVNKNGIIYSKIHDRAVNGEDFKVCLEELNSSYILKGIENPIIVMDNARIHHYKGLQDLIVRENLDLKYLHPYSPFLNPIENVFSVWKNLVISKQCKNENELKVAIKECFLEINPQHCDSFYRKMLGYITKSSRGEVILE